MQLQLHTHYYNCSESDKYYHQLCITRLFHFFLYFFVLYTLTKKIWKKINFHAIIIPRFFSFLARQSIFLASSNLRYLSNASAKPSRSMHLNCSLFTRHMQPLSFYFFIHLSIGQNASFISASYKNTLSHSFFNTTTHTFSRNPKQGSCPIYLRKGIVSFAQNEW